MSSRAESGSAPPGGDPVRKRIAAALVELVAAQGVEATTVAAICARAGVERVDFERCFAGAEECFLDVLEEVADAFCVRATGAYAGPRSWHDRIWAAAWAAMRFLQEDPARARFLVLGVNGAGARAQARRDRVLEGIADLIEAGRAERGGGDPGGGGPGAERGGGAAAVSRSTAEMVTGAIYAAAAAKIRDGALERREDFLSELVYMAMVPYLGARAAEDELLVQPLR